MSKRKEEKRKARAKRKHKETNLRKAGVIVSRPQRRREGPSPFGTDWTLPAAMALLHGAEIRRRKSQATAEKA